MTIVRPLHPFEGKRLEVFGWQQRRGELVLSLVLPDGSKSLVSAAWTDLDGGDSAGASVGFSTLAAPADLLCVAVIVEGLIRRIVPAAGNDAAHPVVFVKGDACAAVESRERDAGAAVGGVGGFDPRRASRNGRRVGAADLEDRRTAKRGGDR